MNATSVIPFEYGGHQVRTHLRADGVILIARVDVCDILGIRDHRQAAERLDPDERGVFTTHPPNGVAPVELAAVTEAGLYSLILTSRRPEAKAFKRWITHEVLPTIRRTGRYEVATVPEPRRELSNREWAVMVIAEADRADAAEQQREIETSRADQAEVKVAELEPAAAAWEHSQPTDDDEAVADTAKWLSLNHAVSTGERKLHFALRQLGWTFRGADGRIRASQRAVNAGWLCQRDASYYDERAEEWVQYPQVRVMKAKGRAALLKHRDDLERYSAQYRERR